MGSTEKARPPRFQFSIRFLFGLTAAVAATCAFGASVGWRLLLLAGLSYACITAYLLIFVLWWRVFGGPSSPRPMVFRRFSTAKAVAACFVLAWFLYLVLIALLPQPS
jgi:hypothetical protein